MPTLNDGFSSGVMPLIMVTAVVGITNVMALICGSASGGFDTVPWNSFVVLILTMGQLDHKRAYMPIFWVSQVVPILISLLGIFFV